jgi:hypothetical protein
MVWMLNETPPIVWGPIPSQTTPIAPSPVRTNAGYSSSHRGLNASRKRRCRQPSRQVRRCGARDRPSLWSTVGTSAIRRPPSAARTTISLANSMPSVCKPSPAIFSRRKPRIPQWKSPTGSRKNSRPSFESTGFPR